MIRRLMLAVLVWLLVPPLAHAAGTYDFRVLTTSAEK